MSGISVEAKINDALRVDPERDERRWQFRRVFVFLLVANLVGMDWFAVVRASSDTVWIIVVANAVCMALIGYVYVDRPYREDLLKLAAVAPQVIGAIGQLAGGGLLGGMFGQRSPMMAATEVPAEELT